MLTSVILFPVFFVVNFKSGTLSTTNMSHFTLKLTFFKSCHCHFKNGFIIDTIIYSYLHDIKTDNCQ